MPKLVELLFHQGKRCPTRAWPSLWGTLKYLGILREEVRAMTVGAPYLTNAQGVREQVKPSEVREAYELDVIQSTQWTTQIFSHTSMIPRSRVIG